MQVFRDRLRPTLNVADLITVMTEVYEYSQLPVRHNEDLLNEELSKSCPLAVAAGSFNSPHTKANLLLQCHFSHQQLPSSDYYTDLKSVLDQSIRVLQVILFSYFISVYMYHLVIYGQIILCVGDDRHVCRAGLVRSYNFLCKLNTNDCASQMARGKKLILTYLNSY